MGLFYDRIEKSDRVVIRYSRLLYAYAVFGIFLIAGFVLPRILDRVSFYFIVVIEGLAKLLIFLFIVIYFIDIWKPSSEVRKAMKEGKVLVSGSKFSLSNPVTVEILKRTSGTLEKKDSAKRD